MNLLTLILLFFVIRAILRMFSAASNQYESQYGHGQTDDFMTALLSLIALIIKADGQIKPIELATVRRKMLELFHDGAQVELIMQRLNIMLSQPINAYQITMAIRQSVAYNVRIEILHILYDIANADGVVDIKERTLLVQLGEQMGLSRADIESVISSFSPINEESVYGVLGIKPSATNDEVKRAYRTMAMKYHPDKVAGLGPEVEENAKRRFQKVQEAYETIKTARGM